MYIDDDVTSVYLEGEDSLRAFVVLTNGKNGTIGRHGTIGRQIPFKVGRL